MASNLMQLADELDKEVYLLNEVKASIDCEDPAFGIEFAFARASKFSQSSCHNFSASSKDKMSLSSVWRFAQRSVVTKFLPTLQFLGGSQQAGGKKFHTICDNCTKIGPSLLVSSPIPLLGMARGMKTKGILQLRCKDCYFVWRKGRRYVMCKSQGRHKQQLMIPKEKNTWILTAATQGKRRAW